MRLPCNREILRRFLHLEHAIQQTWDTTDEHVGLQEAIRGREGGAVLHLCRDDPQGRMSPWCEGAVSLNTSKGKDSGEHVLFFQQRTLNI